MRTLLLGAAVATWFPALALAQAPPPPTVAPTPDERGCAQLIANTANSGKPITDCALDLAAQRLVIRGDGWTKLDLDSLCSTTVAAWNNGGHFSIELKQGRNDAGTRIDCNLSNGMGQ